MKKNVLYINTINYGGAWKFLQQRAKFKDVEILTFSHIWFRIDRIRLSNLCKLLVNRLHFKFVKGDAQPTYISRRESLLKRAYLHKLAREYQEIHVFRFANFLSIDDIEFLASQTELSVYILDESSLFPRCSYKGNCKEYLRNCRNCQFGENSDSITTSSARIYYIDPDHKNLIDFSLFRDWKCEVLFLLQPYNARISLVEAIARTKESLTMRNKLKLILAALDWTERKGISLLEGLLAYGYLDNYDVTIVGRGLSKFRERFVGVKFIEHLDMNDLESVFVQSDVFVSLSIYDTGPFTVNIAYYTGCLIVGTPVGIIKSLNNDRDVIGIAGLDIDEIYKVLENLNLNRELYASYLSERVD